MEKLNLRHTKMSPIKKIFYEKIIKKFEIINLLNFVNYKTNTAKEILKQEFEWENYGDKHHESFTKFFKDIFSQKNLI